jgi:hypothetical protein
MKKLVLSITLLLIAIIALSAQMEKRSEQPPQLAIFPNPATEYITINNEESVRSLVVFNMASRKMRTFDIQSKGERYDIGDLPNGLYIVQMIGKNNKILTTQRLTKKSY